MQAQGILSLFCFIKHACHFVNSHLLSDRGSIVLPLLNHSIWSERRRNHFFPFEFSSAIYI